MQEHARNSSVIFLCSLLFFSVGSSGQAISVRVDSSGDSLIVDYGGRTRLSGGVPLLETVDLERGIKSDVRNRYTFGTTAKSITVSAWTGVHANTVGFYLSGHFPAPVKGTEYAGLFFAAINGYKSGVAFYRYKPWNSWTKPVRISALSDLEPWDNQCFYWQAEDGTYGVAIPLCGQGYRTTLGRDRLHFGSKALSYVENYQADSIPALAIGFGNNLYEVISNVYESALTMMGKTENLIRNKKYPEPLEYIGWCTWNASELGKKLSERTVLKGVESFRAAAFPLGWVLLDDGWFNHRNAQLRSLRPDTVKFPNGFRDLVSRLKNQYGIKHVGAWHAFNGYWNGIDPESPLGKNYGKELFAWKQIRNVDQPDSPVVSYQFIRPESDSLPAFYRHLHAYLKKEGITFIKVDNQLSSERMSHGNFPIGQLAENMHRAVNSSAKEYFDNAMINCMDMTSDAYYNFGATPVARSVEDYFPFEKQETYDLQRGNAAAHILQGVYNNLYFSQMVFPDLDMFQSHNPNGEYHAIARAINNGPVYVTDEVGLQNFEILKKLTLHDGKILRAEHALLPAADCLFQLQDKKVFKAFSYSRGIGLLGAWNAADADSVKGFVSPADAGMQGKKFGVFEHFSGKLYLLGPEDKIPVTMARMGYQLFYIAPLKNGTAALGLIDKYNAPATIVETKVTKNNLTVRIAQGGTFAAVLPDHPKRIYINAKQTNNFTFRGSLLTLDVPLGTGGAQEVLIKF